jgi:hypothetical protein
MTTTFFAAGLHCITASIPRSAPAIGDTGDEVIAARIVRAAGTQRQRDWIELVSYTVARQQRWRANHARFDFDCSHLLAQRHATRQVAMTSLSKVFLTLAAIAVASLVLIGGGAWYWWDQNSADLLDAGKAAISEGQKSGSDLDEEDCVASALDRHKADGNRSFGSALRNNLWLSGCLNASRPQERFCTSVPVQSEAIAVALWSAQLCAQHDLSDSYCPNLLQGVAKYCSSSQRADKLNRSVPSRRALYRHMSQYAPQSG